MDTIDLADFIICNKEEMRKDIKQDVKQFLAKATIFDGLFRIVFDQHLKEFIISQLKLNLIRDMPFNLTSDQLCDTLTEEFLRSVTDNHFFDRVYYEQ